jgi:XTP/dITP diphosphohydrolase
MKLVIATRNAGKLKEIRRLLSPLGVEVEGLDDLACPIEVVEDGDSFVANARKKATEIAAATGRLTLADDSGLMVEALAGAPGIYSARYAGIEADDSANNRKLLQELSGIPPEGRTAAFVCAMALVAPDGACREFSGRLSGRILEGPRGSGGFGYDPLFLVPEYGKTLAELSLDIKNRISHRGVALRQVIAELAHRNRADHPDSA